MVAAAAAAALPSTGTAPAPEPTPTRRRARFMVRGESVIASVGITLSAILLAAIAGASYWGLAEQRAAWMQSRAEQVRIVGELLGGATETMLAHEELSTVRRIIA